MSMKVIGDFVKVNKIKKFQEFINRHPDFENNCRSFLIEEIRRADTSGKSSYLFYTNEFVDREILRGEFRSLDNLEKDHVRIILSKIQEELDKEGFETYKYVNNRILIPGRHSSHRAVAGQKLHSHYKASLKNI